MKLKICAVYGNNKSRKEVTFEVPDEVANYFIAEFKAKNETGECSAQVDGNAAMRINLSVLHTEQRF